MVSIVTQLYMLKWHLWLLYLILHLEGLLGEKKEWHFKKCTKATYYCCVWQSCHSCHRFLLCQLPFFSVNGKSQSSIRKVDFWTLYSYLAYPLCLIKNDAVKFTPGQGSGCQAGAAGAIRNHLVPPATAAEAPAAQHAPAWGTALSFSDSGWQRRLHPFPPPAKAAALRSSWAQSTSLPLFTVLASLGARGDYFCFLSAVSIRTLLSQAFMDRSAMCTWRWAQGCAGVIPPRRVTFSSRLFLTSPEDPASSCLPLYSKHPSHQLWLAHIYILEGRAWTHRRLSRDCPPLQRQRGKISSTHQFKREKKPNKLKWYSNHNI